MIAERSEWAVITCTAKFKAPANGSYRSARSHRSLPSQLRELSTSRSSVKSILLKCVQESIRAPEIHDSLVNHRRGPDRAHRKTRSAAIENCFCNSLGSPPISKHVDK